ncbi:MAG: RES family NAD+ phosphorylase [Hymenobacter sp.]
MRVFRLQNRRYVSTFLDGEGARLNGGRWNPVGTPLVYTSTTPELAVLEVMVHADGTPLQDLPPQVQIELDVPDEVVVTIAAADLPAGWSLPVPPNGLAQFLLPRLAAGQPFLGFALPSAVMPTSPSRNVLLNPQHPWMSQVRVVEVLEHRFDGRL